MSESLGDRAWRSCLGNKHHDTNWSELEDGTEVQLMACMIHDV